MFANNKDTDLPAHLRSLISVFFNHLLKSIVSELANGEVLIFYQASVAEQASFDMRFKW